jgi:hypothetical protein
MEDEDLIDFDEARPAGLHSLRLPAFWVDKPVSWFVLAESRFRLHGIHREQTRYDYLVSALTKEAVSLVLDVVEHPPERLPYSALKQSLLDSHQLSDYQKIAALHKMEPLGGRKPSELLASMLELCPRGHETSIFFTHLFLERRPAELRITLGEEAGPAEFSTSLASSTPPLTSQPRTYAEAVAGPPDWRLQLASMVYIKRGGSGPPLAPAYAGPYKVVRPGHKYFVVEVGGRQESVSVDRLKPHLGASPLPAASPPRRGRPPREPPCNSSASP